jgi:hypothetical protein
VRRLKGAHLDVKTKSFGKSDASLKTGSVITNLAGLSVKADFSRGIGYE